MGKHDRTEASAAIFLFLPYLLLWLFAKDKLVDPLLLSTFIFMLSLVVICIIGFDEMLAKLLPVFPFLFDKCFFLFLFGGMQLLSLASLVKEGHQIFFLGHLDDLVVLHEALIKLNWDLLNVTVLIVGKSLVLHCASC